MMNDDDDSDVDRYYYYYYSSVHCHPFPHGPIPDNLARVLAIVDLAMGYVRDR